VDEVRAYHFALTQDQVGVLANAGTLAVQAGAQGAAINPTQFGAFFEEINHSGDGGLYAELVRNRSLKEDDRTPVHWSAVAGGSAVAAVSLDFAQPLNAADDRSLRLDVTGAAAGERAGAANDGYWGIPVRAGETYRVSLFAKAGAGFDRPLDVSIESADGSQVWARTRLQGVGTDWRQLEGRLTASRCHHVYVAVVGAIAGNPAADLQHLGVAARSILQAMAVAVTGREAGSVAGPERLFAAVGNEDDLAGEDIHKLILAGVPMPLARPRAGRQAQQVDAELRQSCPVAEPLSLARSAGRIKGRRVERADYGRQRGDVDPLRHCSLPLNFTGYLTSTSSRASRLGPSIMTARVLPSG